MSATVINLIIQLIAGAIGGWGGGTLLTSLIPLLAGMADNVDIGAWPSGGRRRDPHGDRRVHQERDGGPNRALKAFCASEANSARGLQ
jgi:hypothetical protein